MSREKGNKGTEGKKCEFDAHVRVDKETAAAANNPL